MVLITINKSQLGWKVLLRLRLEGKVFQNSTPDIKFSFNVFTSKVIYMDKNILYPKINPGVSLIPKIKIWSN